MEPENSQLANSVKIAPAAINSASRGAKILSGLSQM
jgi:hypothetical protein